jgi:hypothetical protein
MYSMFKDNISNVKGGKIHLNQRQNYANFHGGDGRSFKPIP